jgi:Glycosyl transferases group 1
MEPNRKIATIESVPAALERARRLLAADRSADALKTLRDRARQGPFELVLQRSIAELALRLGEDCAALEALTVLVVHDPEPGPWRTGFQAVSSRLGIQPLPAGPLQERFRRNVVALAKHQPEVAATLEQSPPRCDDCYRTSDGSPQILTDQGLWLGGLRDQRMGALDFLAQHLGDGRPGVALVGMGLGYELDLVYHATVSTQAEVAAPPLVVLEPDLEHARRVLCLHEWEEVLGSGRVFLLLGADVAQQAVALYGSREGLPLPERYLGRDLGRDLRRQRLMQAVFDLFRTLTRERAKLLRRRQDEVQQIYARRSPSESAAALRGEAGRPARILLITSLYTSVLRFAARDLADGLRDRGCEARVFLEESRVETARELPYYRTLIEFQPDAIVLLNHLRYEEPQRFPASIPVVTWIQDEMPNIFSKQAAAQVGGPDLVLASWSNTLHVLLTLGYPASNLGHLPLSTNPKVFQPVAHLRARPEVAFVSHASTPPEEVLAALLHSLPEGSPSAAVAAKCYERMMEIPEGDQDLEPAAYGTLVAEAEERAGVRLNPTDRHELLRWLRFGIGNALMRHRPLLALVEAGIDLALYGRGWEHHPQLRRYARGVAENGPQLNRVYQESALHLHISPFTTFHWRLIDGLAAGGLFLIRRNGREPLLEELSRDHDAVELRRRLSGAPWPSVLRGPGSLPVPANFDELRRLLHLLNLGWLEVDPVQGLRCLDAAQIRERTFLDDRMFYRTSQELVGQVGYWLSHPEERQELCTRLRHRIRGAWTYGQRLGGILTQLAALADQEQAQRAAVA